MNDLPPYEDDNQALAELLSLYTLIFPLDVEIEDKETNIKMTITAMFVNANDVFWWGCADMEPLPTSEIETLYNLCRDVPCGSIKWLCRRRQMRPQHPWEELLKKNGLWDEEYESYPVRDFTG